MPSFCSRDSNSGTCEMKACMSQIREKVTSLFQASSSVMMSFALVTMWLVCSRQLESPVTPASGASSSTAHAGASQPCCFMTETCIHPSLHLVHSVQLKEEYSSVKILLEALKCEKYSLKVIRDFKMLTFLMDLQGGFTKFLCYLCLWDSRGCAAPYQRQNWPQRAESQPSLNKAWALEYKCPVTSRYLVITTVPLRAASR